MVFSLEQALNYTWYFEVIAFLHTVKIDLNSCEFKLNLFKGTLHGTLAYIYGR